MAISKLDDSLFANVDLDIYSKTDLRPLVDALGDSVIEMWVGRVRRTYEAHLEVSWEPRKTPSSIILRFCRLINALPPTKRRNMGRRQNQELRYWNRCARTKPALIGAR